MFCGICTDISFSGQFSRIHVIITRFNYHWKKIQEYVYHISNGLTHKLQNNVQFLDGNLSLDLRCSSETTTKSVDKLELLLYVEPKQSIYTYTSTNRRHSSNYKPHKTDFDVCVKLACTLSSYKSKHKICFQNSFQFNSKKKINGTP